MKAHMMGLGASLAVLLLLLTGCRPVTPDGGIPRDPTDKTLVVQLWTNHEEPVEIRLTALNQNGKPLVGDHGQILDNYREIVMTSFGGVPLGEPAIWEIPLDYAGSITGTLKVMLKGKDKVGCRVFSVPPLVPGKEQTARVERPEQQQESRGPVFNCHFLGD